MCAACIRVVWYVLVRVVVWLMSVVVVAVLSLLSVAGCIAVVEWKRQLSCCMLLFAIICFVCYSM